MNSSAGKLYYLKKITQIVVSVSVISLLYSQSSLVPLLVESYDYIFSNHSIKLFTYKTERNYIFLLCNGILALIIQTSGLISKITPFQSHRIVELDDHHHQSQTVLKPKINVVEIRSKKDEVFDDQQEKLTDDDDDHKLEEDDQIIIVDEDIDHNYQNDEIEKWEEDDDDDDYYEDKDEEEEDGIDELNKKFEDFIKKMKQEIMGPSK